MSNGNGYQQGVKDQGSGKPLPAPSQGTHAGRQNYIAGRNGK